MLKIAFITHYSELYGANRSLLNLIDGLKDYDVEPYLVSSFGGKITDEAKKRDIAFRVLPCRLWYSKTASKSVEAKEKERFTDKSQKLARKIASNIKASLALTSQLRQWGVHLVYTNSAVIPVGALSAAMLGIPHIWHLREFVDLDYGHQFVLGKKITTRIISSATHRIAISKSIYSHYIGSKPADNASVIYNGVAFHSEFDQLFEQASSRRHRQNDDTYTFALVGTVHPAKGQAIAIRAMAHLKQRTTQSIGLLIAGKGDTSALEQLAADLDLTAEVRFLGHIDDPYDVYLSSDALLMCSRSEGMGRVTVEAMATCLPVIGFDNAGTSEIIVHNKTGLLYKGGPDELADCMSQMIKNQTWATELGLAGWHIARENYSVETYANQIYQVIEHVAIERT